MYACIYIVVHMYVCMYEDPNGLDERLSFLRSQRFVPIIKKNTRGSHKGGQGVGGSLARFTNLKNRGSPFTDNKISFSRITKISKYDTLYKDLFLH